MGHACTSGDARQGNGRDGEEGDSPFSSFFQQHLKELYKKQQQQIHNNIQLLQQQSNKKTEEVSTFCDVFLNVFI